MLPFFRYELPLILLEYLVFEQDSVEVGRQLDAAVHLSLAGNERKEIVVVAFKEIVNFPSFGDKSGKSSLHVPLLTGCLLSDHLIVGDGLPVGGGADVAVAVRELGEVVRNTARVLLVVT